MAHLLLISATSIILILLFHSPATAAQSAVLDSQGNPLEAGKEYYVLSGGRGAAGRGGLIAASKPPNLCPRYVAQLSSEWDIGMSVSFHPADPSQKHITEGTEVNIAFSGPSHCRDEGVWKLSFDEQTNVPYVTTEGVIGNPGPDTFANWFKIEKATDFSYKLVYCFLKPEPANALNRQRENCQQLDAAIPGPNTFFSWLSLVNIDNPLPFFGFTFQKASTKSYY